MVKVDKLSEYYIRDIKKEDFDMNKLVQNGDAIIRIEFVGNNEKAWKRGWTMDGERLLDLDYQSSSQNQPQFQPAYVQPQYPPYQPQYPPQQPGFSPQQQYSGYPPYQRFPPQQYPTQPQYPPQQYPSQQPYPPH